MIDFIIDYNDNSILIAYTNGLKTGVTYNTLNKSGQLIKVQFTEYEDEYNFEIEIIKTFSI